jgi:hypothetical protein
MYKISDDVIREYLTSIDIQGITNKHKKRGKKIIKKIEEVYTIDNLQVKKILDILRDYTKKIYMNIIKDKFTKYYGFKSY